MTCTSCTPLSLSPPPPPPPLECLEVIGEMIKNNGMTVCQPSPAKSLPVVAGQICDRDNGVRSAAINTMVVVYGYVGEGVYKFASQVSMCCISYLYDTGYFVKNEKLRILQFYNFS